MSDEQELRQRIKDAWAELQRYQYEVIEPRFYREKRGRRLELINPWKTLKERIIAEEKGHEIYWHFHKLQTELYKLTGETVEVHLHYRKQETPNGDRYVRRSDL
jgi:hypothetical protein